MVRSSDACCVMGLKSTAQAAIFGLSCAALGAVVASFCWATVELDIAVSPRLVKAPKLNVARKIHGQHANSTTSVVSEVKLASPCCANQSECPSDIHAESHACPHCALKQAKLACDGPFAVPFVPLHERSDYCANSPDILKVQIERLATEAAPTEALSLGGEYLIDPEGRLKIGDSVKVQAGGLTMNEIAANIQQALDTPETKHRVDVSVVSQNSHVYYVITEGAKLGDTVARYPIAGNETALDAVAKHGCLSQLAHHKVWIARPVPGSSAPDTVIPVSWQWTSADTMTCTNPALQSGDRIFIATPGPSWMAFVERAAVLAKHLQATRVAPSTPEESQAH